jgi:hypothetical protein
VYLPDEDIQYSDEAIAEFESLPEVADAEFDKEWYRKNYHPAALKGPTRERRIRRRADDSD